MKLLASVVSDPIFLGCLAVISFFDVYKKSRNIQRSAETNKNASFLLINLRFDIIYAFYLTGTRYVFALNSSQKIFPHFFLIQAQKVM